ncbi:MAG: hypothetical protein U0822_17365 [Anaerolineae bacterium]
MRARLLFTGLLVLILLSTLSGVAFAQDPEPQSEQSIAATVGTSFTYQGSLVDNGAPASGTYDLQFRLYNDDTAGSQVGSTLTGQDVPVTNGLFTVRLDFGNVFDGTQLWLEVAVRPGSSTDAFTTLSPRQRLTAAPYAVYSTYSANALNAWNLSGNTGTSNSNFLGTKDSQPLIMKTNNNEALRIDSSGNVSVSRGNFSVTPGNVNIGSGSLNVSSGNIIVSNGSIGIGTAGPGAKLEAYTTAGAIGLMGTSNSRGVLGRLGVISCPGGSSNLPYAVGGCAGTTAGYGVVGMSDSNVAIHAESGGSRAVEGFATAGGIGVIGDSSARGVVGTLGRGPCAGTYGVGGCGGTTGDGVVGRTSVGANTFTAAAMHAINDNGGDIFIGEGFGARKARIDSSGKGYFNGGTQGSGADYAESIRSTDDAAKLEPGDVLEIDPQEGYAVRQSREPSSRLVAGVYSTRPSVLAVGEHGVNDSLAGEVPVAMLGVVPTKVTAENGPIEVGDLLVTSSSPGRAMKAKPASLNGVEVYPTGAILGKALEPLPKGTGIIKVLVTLK